MNTPKPLERLRLSQTNRPVDVIIHWHRENAMELNPPYQRGDVWGEVRQANLIKSILINVPIPSIIINDRFSAGWDDNLSCVVIDGKQRITALLKFLLGQLSVPAEWFGREGRVSFLDLTEVEQRRFKQSPIAFSEGYLGSLKDEEEVFNLVNYGGVPQGESDL